MIGRATLTQGSLRVIHLFVRLASLSPLALSLLDQALRELAGTEMILPLILSRARSFCRSRTRRRPPPLHTPLCALSQRSCRPSSQSSRFRDSFSAFRAPQSECRDSRIVARSPHFPLIHPFKQMALVDRHPRAPSSSSVSSTEKPLPYFHSFSAASTMFSMNLRRYRLSSFIWCQPASFTSRSSRRTP